MRIMEDATSRELMEALCARHMHVLIAVADACDGESQGSEHIYQGSPLVLYTLAHLAADEALARAKE